MGMLAGLRRLWESKDVTSLITSPGEENPHHTPLPVLIDAGDFRGLVAQLTLSWQAAFAQVEEFRQVRMQAYSMANMAQTVKAPGRTMLCHSWHDII